MVFVLLLPLAYETNKNQNGKEQLLSNSICFIFTVVPKTQIPSFGRIYTAFYLLPLNGAAIL